MTSHPVHQTIKRLSQEHIALSNEPLPSGITTQLIDPSDLFHWTATIPTPNHAFSLNITFPSLYPRNAPQMTATTPIFHPNISSDGSIGLPELAPDQWTPAFSLGVLLISLQVLLEEPNVMEGCVLNEEAAKLWREDREAYLERVKAT